MRFRKAVASEAEMVAAMYRYRVYNSDVEAYLRRLEFEENRRRISRSTRNRLHNDAIDTLRMTVGKFNLQVRIFKERQNFRVALGSGMRH